MNDESNNLYNYYYGKSKRLYNQQRIKESLENLKKAYEIFPTNVLQIKINKLEDLINTKDGVQFKVDENKLKISDNHYVDPLWYDKLYKHQQEGIKWLLTIFEQQKGGILADDMGLGKTVQAIFFLRELFESNLIKTVLIIMPKSLLINWEREFRAWGPNMRVLTYFGNEKEKNLRKILYRGGVLITTYNSVVYNWADLNQNGQNKFDILILDEGHKIKNTSSKTFKAISALRSTFRLILTGTAVQNNLKELWALFDFTHQGTLLGTYTTFKMEYERPITESRKKDAGPNIKAYGNMIGIGLKSIIRPYMLRRTKEEIILNLPEEDIKKNFPKLPSKNELVIWIKLSSIQKDCYRKFLKLDDVKMLLTQSDKRSPLLELNILKKICDHPRLLPADYCEEMGMAFAKTMEDVADNDLLQESGKSLVVMRLLEKLTIEETHKCLVFSQSKVILNIISRLLRCRGIRQERLDGDVLMAAERQNIIDRFNNSDSIKVMLLTTQVGGVGLTLTAADRVIICDVSWNPAVDSQAVDRVYRIGQRKNVVVYRLVTCGTVEEKIYRRQIFKESLNRQTTGVAKTDDNPYRYFTQNDLVELFELGDFNSSETQQLLEEKHSSSRRNYKELDDHIMWLTKEADNGSDNIFGLSDHDLMFSEADNKVKLGEDAMINIENDVKEAETRLKMESEIKKNADVSNLHNLMNNMTLSNQPLGSKKWLSKLEPPEMFIPSTKDRKRTNLNSLKQTTLGQYFSSENNSSKFTNKHSTIIIEDSEEENDDNSLISDKESNGNYSSETQSLNFESRSSAEYDDHKIKRNSNFTKLCSKNYKDNSQEIRKVTDVKQSNVLNSDEDSQEYTNDESSNSNKSFKKDYKNDSQEIRKVTDVKQSNILDSDDDSAEYTDESSNSGCENEKSMVALNDSNSDTDDAPAVKSADRYKRLIMSDDEDQDNSNKENEISNSSNENLDNNLENQGIDESINNNKHYNRDSNKNLDYDIEAKKSSNKSNSAVSEIDNSITVYEEDISNIKAVEDSIESVNESEFSEDVSVIEESF